jgi:hypothetical protein
VRFGVLLASCDHVSTSASEVPPGIFSALAICSVRYGWLGTNPVPAWLQMSAAAATTLGGLAAVFRLWWQWHRQAINARSRPKRGVDATKTKSRLYSVSSRSGNRSPQTPRSRPGGHGQRGQLDFAASVRGRHHPRGSGSCPGTHARTLLPLGTHCSPGRWRSNRSGRSRCRSRRLPQRSGPVSGEYPVTANGTLPGGPDPSGRATTSPRGNTLCSSWNDVRKHGSPTSRRGSSIRRPTWRTRWPRWYVSSGSWNERLGSLLFGGHAGVSSVQPSA